MLQTIKQYYNASLRKLQHGSLWLDNRVSAHASTGLHASWRLLQIAASFNTILLKPILNFLEKKTIITLIIK